MTTNKPSLVIIDEIRDFIMPLTAEDFQNLENSIVREGCRDALIAWSKSVDEHVIVDGHHRYKICKKHELPFNYKTLPFQDIEHVKLWMIQNQIGRRNLTQDQLSYYRGLKYLALKKKRGGFENTRLRGTSETSTSTLLSREFNLSPSTIKRDSKFAEGLNIIGNADPVLKMKILTGELSVKKSIIASIARLKDTKKILNAILEGKSDKHLPDERRTTIVAVNGREAKLKKIKALIINLLNRVIVHKNPDEVNELKVLVGRLERELLSESEMTGVSALREAQH